MLIPGRFCSGQFQHHSIPVIPVCILGICRLDSGEYSIGMEFSIWLVPLPNLILLEFPESANSGRNQWGTVKSSYFLALGIFTKRL